MNEYARMATLVTIAACGAPAGCALNLSPIHDGMTKDEMREKVHERFHVGMTSTEAKEQLRALDLSYRFVAEGVGPCEGSGPRGYEAAVYPAGFHMWRPYGPLPDSILRVWFDGHDGLSCVAFRPAPIPPVKVSPPQWNLLP